MKISEAGANPVCLRLEITKDVLKGLGFKNNEQRVEVTHFKEVFEETSIKPKEVKK